MAEEIRHQGVVDMIDGQTVVVRIMQQSACSGCHARGICRAAESKEKLVDVHCTDASALSVGQEVTVCGEESLGMKAVGLAFGLPLLLLMVALIVGIAVSGSEKVGAICAFAVLVPYYTLLYVLRDRIKDRLQFRIIQY